MASISSEIGKTAGDPPDCRDASASASTRAIALLKREIDLQMGQMGCAGTEEVGPQWLLA